MTEFFHSEYFSWDKSLLQYINSHNSSFFDSFMWIISSHIFGILFFIFIAAIIAYTYRRESIKVLIIILLTVIIADFVSAKAIKPLVQRPRPTHDLSYHEGYQMHLHEKDDGTFYYGGAWGFPSNHAANFMTITVLFAYFYKNRSKYSKLLIISAFLITLLVGYSRSYLAVHYPSDVISGWIIGGIFVSLSIIFTKRFVKINNS